MSGCVSTATVWHPFAPSEARGASKDCPPAKGIVTADGYVADPRQEGPDHGWQVRLMLVALGGTNAS